MKIVWIRGRVTSVIKHLVACLVHWALYVRCVCRVSFKVRIVLEALTASASFKFLQLLLRGYRQRHI